MNNEKLWNELLEVFDRHTFPDGCIDVSGDEKDEMISDIYHFVIDKLSPTSQRQE